MSYPFTFHAPNPTATSSATEPAYTRTNRAVRSLPPPPENRRPSARERGRRTDHEQESERHQKRGWSGEGVQGRDTREDNEDEAHPPTKKRRGIAGTILDTSFKVALVGTAVAITGYRLWRDRCKPTSPSPEPGPFNHSSSSHPPPPSSKSNVKSNGLAWPIESRVSADGDMGGQEGKAVDDQRMRVGEDEGMGMHAMETGPPPPAYRETPYLSATPTSRSLSASIQHAISQPPLSSPSLESPDDDDEDDPQFYALNSKLSSMLAEAQSALAAPSPSSSSVLRTSTSFSTTPSSSRSSHQSYDAPRSSISSSISSSTNRRTSSHPSIRPNEGRRDHLLIEEFDEGGAWRPLPSSSASLSRSSRPSNSQIPRPRPSSVAHPSPRRNGQTRGGKRGEDGVVLGEMLDRTARSWGVDLERRG